MALWNTLLKHVPIAGGSVGLPLVVCLSPLIALSTILAGAGEDATVTVAGGADVSGQVYTWTVTNRYPSPVVGLEFPHYRATLFFAPVTWLTDCTFLVNVGVEDSPGVCVATAPAPTEGIPPGRSAEFSMQCSAAGARRAMGAVTVRFADGKEIEVAGVELPTREGVGDKYVPLVGLGAIAVILVLVAALRRRSAAWRRKLCPCCRPEREG